MSEIGPGFTVERGNLQGGSVGPSENLEPTDAIATAKVPATDYGSTTTAICVWPDGPTAWITVRLITFVPAVE